MMILSHGSKADFRIFHLMQLLTYKIHGNFKISVDIFQKISGILKFEILINLVAKT